MVSDGNHRALYVYRLVIAKDFVSENILPGKDRSRDSEITGELVGQGRHIVNLPGIALGGSLRALGVDQGQLATFHSVRRQTDSGQRQGLGSFRRGRSLEDTLCFLPFRQAHR